MNKTIGKISLWWFYDIKNTQICFRKSETAKFPVNAIDWKVVKIQCFQLLSSSSPWINPSQTFISTIPVKCFCQRYKWLSYFNNHCSDLNLHLTWVASHISTRILGSNVQTLLLSIFTGTLIGIVNLTYLKLKFWTFPPNLILQIFFQMR